MDDYDLTTDLKAQIEAQKVDDGVYKYEREDGHHNVFEVKDNRVKTTYTEKDDEREELIPEDLLELHTTQVKLLESIHTRELELKQEREWQKIRESEAEQGRENER